MSQSCTGESGKIGAGNCLEFVVAALFGRFIVARAIVHFLESATSFDALRSARLPDRLSFTAIAYLLVPNLIFLAGWFHPALSLPLCALGVWGAWQLAREMFAAPYSGPDRRALLLIIALAACWASLGGGGHFFFANNDWQVRDAVLGDLVFGAWPAAYANPAGEPLLLRTAMGYYLPAALAGKVFGIAWVDWILYAWTALGATIFFVLLPLPHRSPLLLIASAVIVVFYSGIDVLGIWLTRNIDLVRFFPNGLDWWVPYSYPALTAQLFWAPNHALPIWILTALLYRHWAHPAFWRLMLFVLPLSLIWTPFAIAGVMPFIALAGLRWWAKRQAPDIDFRFVVFAILLGYVTLRFITLDMGGLPIHLPGAVPKGTNVSLIPAPSMRDYLVFIEMEFGILALALLPTLRHSFGLYGVAVAMLLLLPIVSLGPSKDSMRLLSAPPLIMLLILVLNNLQDWARARSFPASAYVIGVILLLGAPSAYYEMARSVLWPRIAPNYGKSLIEQQGGTHPPHYVARSNQPDLQWLMNTPRIVPSSGERPK